MSIAEFFFGNIWHFLGLAILVGGVLNGLAEVIRAARGK